MNSWLDDFVEYTSVGETPARIMRWVGVFAIAAVLRRKVFIDQERFQWTPNFYILLIAPPGEVMKSTSMDEGMKLLKKIYDENGERELDLGPQITTWQQLLVHMEESYKLYPLPNDPNFGASCVSIGLSELGLLFDPDDKFMVTNLTDMWDGKLGTLSKETKTSGNTTVENAWLNLIGCATPEWIAKNFGNNLIGEGFGSRPVYLYAEQGERFVAYPKMQAKSAVRAQMERDLIERLTVMSKYAGEMHMTPEAYAWGTQWYEEYREARRSLPQQHISLTVRKQTHLHKLAMVLSCAKGKFPVIDVEEMKEALAMLDDVEQDAFKIFGFVDRREEQIVIDTILDMLKHGKLPQSEIMMRAIQLKQDPKKVKELLQSLEEAHMVVREGSTANPSIRLVEPGIAAGQ